MVNFENKKIFDLMELSNYKSESRWYYVVWRGRQTLRITRIQSDLSRFINHVISGMPHHLRQSFECYKDTDRSAYLRGPPSSAMYLEIMQIDPVYRMLNSLELFLANDSFNRSILIFQFLTLRRSALSLSFRNNCSWYVSKFMYMYIRQLNE